MARTTRRATALALAAVLAVGVAALSGPTPASGQAEAAPPTLQALTLPPGGAAEAGVTATQANRGTGAEVGAAERNDGVGPAPLAREAGAESVIGADGRVQVTNTANYPARAIGQIEGSDNSVGDYICTGWLIDADSILTSGHCVYPEANNLAESITFFPGRNASSDPNGSCAGVTAWAPDSWIQNQAEAADLAVVNLNCSIGSTLGWFGIRTVSAVNGLYRVRARVQGYPGDKPFGTHWGMTDRIEVSARQLVGYDLDTAGGQSGSPVWWNNAACAGGPCGMAVHSYGVHAASGIHSFNHGVRITATRFNQICAQASLSC